ncbi:Secretion-regulating guanine nucleotide exchange factor [Frankliniella fusca]|uniref:Secretion-regulating guanine nucleotide exchange factor n=1 Tax=Frankliniella fusca TaxID=407009 RepID=A0AAE1GPW4_9NEOP|nr:Secretion-regulating guanine nucleotide exchange factor [Frankliniella fusca]
MKLYSWGANSHGQLGQNMVSEACCIPTEIIVPNLNPDHISSIVGGGGHTLALDRSGRVYSCGWNNKGQLGSAENEVMAFQPIETLTSQITQLACGWDSSLAVAADGTLIVWGSNHYSQLGLPKQRFNLLKSPKSLPFSKVKQASLGLRHLALVTEDGNVFVSGSGSKGQLGLADANGQPFSEISTLTQVSELRNIVGVSCGQHHCIALSNVGKIFVWGDNRFGQLGFDSTVQPVVYQPQELPLSAIPGVTGHPSSIYAGWTHSVLLTDKGEIVNWGRNIYGQLGADGRNRAVSWNPTLLRLSDRIKQVAVGSEHNVILTETGSIMSWGWNEHGNCGVGTQENVLEPTLVQIGQMSKANVIGSGACHSFAIVDPGSDM